MIPPAAKQVRQKKRQLKTIRELILYSSTIMAGLLRLTYLKQSVLKI